MRNAGRRAKGASVALRRGVPYECLLPLAFRCIITAAAGQGEFTEGCCTGAGKTAEVEVTIVESENLCFPEDGGYALD